MTRFFKDLVMTEKETYWSRFADDFEDKSNYVVGKNDVDIVLRRLAEQKDLKTWGKPSPHAKTLKLTYARDMISQQGLEITRSDLLGVKSRAIF